MDLLIKDITALHTPGTYFPPHIPPGAPVRAAAAAAAAALVMLLLPPCPSPRSGRVVNPRSVMPHQCLMDQCGEGVAGKRLIDKVYTFMKDPLHMQVMRGTA